MSIINITDRERELENALAKEQRLNGMGAEREYVLHGKVTQLTRALEQATEVLNLITKERNALKAELGDLPNSQAAMMCEIKVLRNALESYANPSNWDEDLHGIRRWWLEPDSSTRKAGYDLASAALTKKNHE